MYINDIGLYTYGDNETFATDLNEYMCAINEKLKQLLDNMLDMVNILSSDLESEIEYELKENLQSHRLENRGHSFTVDSRLWVFFFTKLHFR